MISPLRKAKDLLWGNVCVFPVPCPNSPKSLWLPFSVPQMNPPGGWGLLADHLTAELSRGPAVYSTPLINHTLKIFIIKSITLCSLYLLFFISQRSPFQGSAWVHFIWIQSYWSWAFSVVQCELQPPLPLRDTPLGFTGHCRDPYGQDAIECFVKQHKIQDWEESHFLSG